MATFLAAATERGTIKASVKVALSVGTALALINYGDRILLNGDMQPIDWIKLVITYCVPYCVATYSAASYAARHAQEKGPTHDH